MAHLLFASSFVSVVRHGAPAASRRSGPRASAARAGHAVPDLCRAPAPGAAPTVPRLLQRAVPRTVPRLPRLVPRPVAAVLPRPRRATTVPAAAQGRVQHRPSGAAPAVPPRLPVPGGAPPPHPPSPPRTGRNGHGGPPRRAARRRSARGAGTGNGGADRPCGRRRAGPSGPPALRPAKFPELFPPAVECTGGPRPYWWGQGEEGHQPELLGLLTFPPRVVRGREGARRARRRRRAPAPAPGPRRRFAPPGPKSTTPTTLAPCTVSTRRFVCARMPP